MKREWRYSGNALLLSLMFAALLTLAYLTAANHDLTWDLTAAATNTLDARSRSVAEGVTGDLKILVFDKPEEEKSGSGDLLRRYRAANARICYEFVDPDLNPERAASYGIDRYGQAVIITDDRRTRIESVTEQAITVGILKATRGKRKLICFSAGHGELGPQIEGRGGASILGRALETLDYEVRTVWPVREAIPAETDLLIVAGARKDFLPAELAELERYRDAGGDIFLTLDPGSQGVLSDLIADYGIRARNDLVVDTFSRVLGGDYTTPVVSLYGDVSALENFRYATFFPGVCSLEIDAQHDRARWIARTSEQSWGETDISGWDKDGRAELDDADTAGPVDIGAYGVLGDDERQSRLMVFGDSDFISDVYLNVSGNSELTMNCINMLLDEDDLIVINPKAHPDKPFVLTPQQGRLIFWLPVVVMPLLIMLLGVAVVRFWRRG